MGDEKRRCIYPCAFGASRHFFCGAMCSCEDRHEGGCRCDAHREPATPPEPAVPVVHASDGKMRPVCGAALDRGDSVRRFGVTCRACVETPEPAALRCIECGAEGAELITDTRCSHDMIRPLSPEPDEAERWASTQAERWLLDSAHGGMLSEDRGYVEALGHDHAHLATLLRAAEARGRERGLEEAARECDQLAGIAERGPWPGRRHEYTSAAKRIRALRSGR